MKLFYTEDEAMAEKLILTTEQPAFIKAYILLVCMVVLELNIVK